MQAKAPYKSYRKTLPSHVYVTVFNPFNQEPEGLILKGEGDEAIVDVWDEMQDLFFKRMNKRHLETGVVVAFVRQDLPEERT